MTPALSLYLMTVRRADPFVRRKLRRSGEATEAQLCDQFGEPADPRHDGELIWLHLASSQPPEVAEALAARLGSERPGARVLLTCDDREVLGRDRDWRLRPLDLPRCAEAFLAHWRPDAAVWIGAPIWPALAAAASQRGIPFVLANADESLIASFRGVPSRELLGLFSLVVACSARAAQSLQRQTQVPVQALGALQRASPPPGYREDELAQFSAALQARPLWLAAGVPEAELGEVRRAQRIAQRTSHRLLLVLLPETPVLVSALGESPDLARRSVTSFPLPAISTFVADLPDEDGLWYCLAPVTYVGGTLSGGRARLDPFAPASLGSAVLHGPSTLPHTDHFEALGQADATWPIAEPPALGPAVSDLQATDRVAALAGRAWSVVTEGAEATDALVERVGLAIDG